MLLCLLAMARAAPWIVAGFVEITFRFRMSGLVRRNLLRLVLDRPGASALPFSIGEAISRFRDDGYEAEDNMDWTDEIISHGIFAIVAFVILLSDQCHNGPGCHPADGCRGRNCAASEPRAWPLPRSQQSGAKIHVTGAIGDIVAAVQTVQAIRN